MVSKKFDHSNSALGMDVEDIHCDVIEGMANPVRGSHCPA
jgi:hypothetical protein